MVDFVYLQKKYYFLIFYYYTIILISDHQCGEVFETFRTTWLFVRPQFYYQSNHKLPMLLF